ncbi:MAG: hypothetical protein JWP25_9035 [Bradyrhizobium sp.]|nr:hypothetical protein [Bradyrhizobium sp.]
MADGFQDNTEKGPDEKSADAKAMAAYWELVNTILGGAEAMRSKHHVYLPKFPEESVEDYDHRRRWAPFTNIYEDISKNLASKPFAKELTLKDGAAQSLVDLCEDIDGQGNSLHVFASVVFQHALDNAIDWILVDYTKSPIDDPGKPRSIAEEKAQGLRPYWVHIGADRVLAVYSDFHQGEEIIIHARIKEDLLERDQWSEAVTERVRVFNRDKIGDRDYAPATFEVWEKQRDTQGKWAWISIEGPTPIDIGVIPMVPFLTGKRIGASWQVQPPLRGIAMLQVEEFQQESNLKSVMELTCYPMLVGAGVGQTVDDKGAPIRVRAGPRSVLLAPMSGTGTHGDWHIIEPTAQSIKTLIDQLDSTQKNMRDLGMQPLNVANLTVITTANIAEKAHSAVQAWALGLKDALEQAFIFTTMWLNDGSAEPEVDVFTDFVVHLEKHAEIETLLKAQSQNVLSKLTCQLEFKRRGVLSDNFDPDDEKQQLAEEQQGLQGEQAIDPVTGEIVQAPTTPVVIGKPAPVTVRPAKAAQVKPPVTVQ